MIKRNLEKGDARMRVRTPSYWREFSCLMGACPDTCCRDWDIALDEAAREFYMAAPGPVGDELRKLVARGGDCLALDHALCPMLDETGLCRVQLAFGEERLTRSCALFPRFAEEYGALREWALAIACPAAARLVLTAAAPAAFTLEKTDEPLDGTNDLDAGLFYCLTKLRTAMFSIALERRLPFETRLALIVRLAAKAQKKLDHGKYSAAQKIAGRFEPERKAGRLAKFRGTDASAAAEILALLRSLDVLTPGYAQLLSRARPDARAAADDPAWENLLVYFLYRYVLKAAVDGDLFGRVRAAAIGVLTVQMLAAAGGGDPDAITDAAYRYGREIEHDADNLMALVRAPLDEKRLLTAILQQNVEAPA